MTPGGQLPLDLAGGPARQPADQAARDRIIRDELHRTLFVEAGAGSGKTTQLVERVVNLVVVEGVRLGEIAAITFTEAAATELRNRVRVQLERLVADNEQPAVARGRATQALADADLAAITTLHGFAGRILGEHPTAAGLPPRVQILDEINSQLDAEARWERFVDSLYADPNLEELLLRAHLAGIALEPQYQGHSTLKDVAAALSDNWDRLGPLVDRVHGPLAPMGFGPFDRAVEGLTALAATCTDHTDLFFAHLTDQLLPELNDLVATADPYRKLGRLVGAKGWGPGRGGKDSGWPGGVKAAKALVKELDVIRSEVLADVCDELLQRFLTLISSEVVASARSRQADGALEFHDLLVLAREMLRASPQTRRALHERYTRLLLDEFQDTDPIQIELAVLIAASVDGAHPSGWSDTAVPDGRLFFVGDPKQSIYRFRRADISLFLAARDRFGADDARVELTTSFRTVGRVVAWVNELFRGVMDVEVPGGQPAYQSLVAHRPDGGPGRRPILFGGPQPKLSAAELRALEANDVACAIADIRDRPDAWRLGDPDSPRDPTLGDITILVPTRTSLPQLREALERRGIRYRLATGTLVYDTQEVRDLLSVVRAVDDPTNELSLIAALRSPLFACSDRDLFRWRSAHGSWDLTRQRPESIVEHDPVALAMAHLHRLWRDRWWIGPSALVERIVRECRCDLLAFADGREADVWRRYRFVIDQARLFEDSGGSGLRGFVAWAELQSADGANVHEPVLPEADETSVRIMTVHGAKGLEFPITILSGLTTKPGNSRSGIKMLWGDDELPSLSVRKGVTTSNHDPRADLEAEMDEFEKHRLLYVACTRASDYLLVSAHHVPTQKKDARVPLSELIWNRMGDSSLSQNSPWPTASVDAVHHPAGDPVASDDSPQDGSPQDGSPIDLADQRNADWAAARAEVVTRFDSIAAQDVPRVASATAIARDVRSSAEDFNATDATDEIDDDLDRDAHLGGLGSSPWDSAVPEPVRRRGRRGSAIGTAVHGVLEFVDFAHPRDIDTLAERFATDEAVSDAGAIVGSMARAALASPALQLAASVTHHKEVYVAAPIGDRVIEGYIDLLIEAPDGGLIVVDYKTDEVTEATVDAKVEHYELQAAAYAVALETSTGLPVIDCRFVFCRPSGAIERSIVDLDAAKAKVREYLESSQRNGTKVGGVGALGAVV